MKKSNLDRMDQKDYNLTDNDDDDDEDDDDEKFLPTNDDKTEALKTVLK